MDINQRIALQAFLGAVGGAVGTMIGGPTGLAIGLIAPSVLVEAAKHFPEPHLIKALDNLPGLLWDGEMMHWVDSNISSMFWKLDNDFSDSPIPGRQAVRVSLKEIQQKARLLGDAAKVIFPHLENLKSKYDPAYEIALGKPSIEAVHTLRNANEIRVNCSIIEPAVLASLLHMKTIWSVPVKIHYTDINGVQQTKTSIRALDKDPFDFIILPIAPFILSGIIQGNEKLSDHYTFLIPVHTEDQYVLRPKFKGIEKLSGVSGVDTIRFLENSSCEEQFRALRRQHQRRFKELPQGLADLASIEKNVDPTEAVILYDPAAEVAARSGKFIKTEKFKLWISMFGLNEFINKNDDISKCFVETFIAAWAYCKADFNRRYVRGLLLKDDDIAAAYRIGRLEM